LWKVHGVLLYGLRLVAVGKQGLSDHLMKAFVALLT
jgi:hypothetical protein